MPPLPNRLTILRYYIEATRSESSEIGGGLRVSAASTYVARIGAGQFSFAAKSPKNRSTECMLTALSSCSRLQ